MQVGEIPAGIQTKLIAYGGGHRPVRLQRVGPPATAMQRQHQSLPEGFPERIGAGQAAQLGQHLAVPSVGQVEIQSTFQR
nr:hypothetical protein [Fodinicola feengrottensis]